MGTIRGVKSETMGSFPMSGVVVAVMVIAAISIVVLRPSGKTVIVLPAEPVDAELVTITNEISKAFSGNWRRWWRCSNCIRDINPIIEQEANLARRVAIARHLAQELLALEFASDDNQSWDLFLSGYYQLVSGGMVALSLGGANESERWKFLFDALLHYKDECIATLDEPKVEPDERDRDRMGGKGVLWTQRMRKLYTESCLVGCPQLIDSHFFKSNYSKLSPELKKYFRKRFREVFGIDYIPYSETNRRSLWGIMGTRWQGEGLEWRVLVGDKDKVLDPKEYWEKNKED